MRYINLKANAGGNEISNYLKTEHSFRKIP